MRQRKKEKKRKEGEDIQGDQLYATGSSMPVVSLCIKEGGWLRIKIVGGTWVGDVRDVDAGGQHHHQDLETAWPLRLLAKQEWGHVKTMFGCVLKGCTNAQDWEKKKRKNGKKKNKKQKRERKKKKHGPTISLYIGFMALAVQCQWSLCRSKGVVNRMPTTGHVQKP